MRFGFDFDNTIVSYDRLFYRVALEKKCIPESTPVNKNAVRDYLRAQNQEHIWTEMQGYVYGARMQEAESFPDALNVITALRDAGHELFIISHKTQKPYMGPPYDLHESARGWIKTHLVDAKNQPLVPEKNVYFHEKKEQKIARIGELLCDTFLDDLPEILLHEQFPSGIRKYLFSAEHPATQQFTIVPDWKTFHKAISHV